MCKVTTKPSLKKNILRMTFLILGSLFISENMYSIQSWNRNYLVIDQDPKKNVIKFTFEFYDYAFGPANEDAFLEYGDFEYSTNGHNYTKLMRTETKNQGLDVWTWVNMKEKLIDAKLKFVGCYVPESGTKWANAQDYRVEVYNRGDKAFLTIKWSVPKDSEVKHIRFSGKWEVRGVWGFDMFEEVYDLKTSNMSLKSEFKTDSIQNNILDKPENDAVKVCRQADAIVITGAAFGANIKVYTASGLHIKSVNTNSDVVKIKLANNQVYIVNIEQAHYKIAL